MRNSRSGEPSKFDPTSARSFLRFLSVNGMLAILDALARASPHAARGVRGLGAPEPACAPHGPELLLLGGELERRVPALGLGRVSAQEVDFDLAHEPAAELRV